MRIGIITGSGTYALPDFEGGSSREVATRFGRVPVTSGTFAGADVSTCPAIARATRCCPRRSPTRRTSPRCGRRGPRRSSR
jgi:purine nucleoside phosphorylase